MSLFHLGAYLFNQFGVDVESEIVFADYCKDNLFVYRDGIRFTKHALLIVEPTSHQNDWLNAESIRFYAWHNILSIQNIRGKTVLSEFDHSQIKAWFLRSHRPIMHCHSLTLEKESCLLFSRSSTFSAKRRGKAKTETMGRGNTTDGFADLPITLPRSVEMMIDIFTTSPAELPDVDRLATVLMDYIQWPCLCG